MFAYVAEMLIKNSSLINIDVLPKLKSASKFVSRVSSALTSDPLKLTAFFKKLSITDALLLKEALTLLDTIEESEEKSSSISNFDIVSSRVSLILLSDSIENRDLAVKHIRLGL